MSHEVVTNSGVEVGYRALELARETRGWYEERFGVDERQILTDISAKGREKFDLDLSGAGRWMPKTQAGNPGFRSRK